jgi:hypothetical protein
MSAEHSQGLLDTKIVILREWIAPAELPAEVAITAITLAELSAGPHEVRRNEEQSAEPDASHGAGSPTS